MHLKMDNKTAIFYINKMGGTRSHLVAHTACQLWQWCLQRGITLSAEHLPGSSNIIADRESRLLHSSEEWMLNRGIFSWMMEVLGPCQLDLFATRLNHQLNRYLSWKPDPFAMATDAFCISWKDKGGYAFPPFALIGRCLQKVREERATLVLVAPTCSAQAWCPTLLELLISDPLLLPKRRDLLTDPFNRFHPMEDLQLAAWKVSGDSTMIWEYQRGLPSSSRLDGVHVGTNTAYQSAWKRWCGWCAERKIDPLSCGVQSFLDFFSRPV